MSYAAMMIEQYQSKGLMLDSNLLLLHLVGSTNSSLVGSGSYNKLSDFSTLEAAFLKQLISGFRRVVTTPHILTEVSNLVNDLHYEGRRQVWGAFVSTLEVISEQTISSYMVARREEFSYLGLTDTVLAEMSNEFLIVSNDGRMVDMLRQNQVIALKWVEVLGLSA
jgi:hypothetical protein